MRIIRDSRYINYYPNFVSSPKSGTVTCDLISVGGEHLSGGTAPNRRMALKLAVDVLDTIIQQENEELSNEQQ